MRIMTRIIEDHISVTLLPEQLMPFQDSTQGSPPFAVHFVSCWGEFKLENKPLRTDAGNAKSKLPVYYFYHRSRKNTFILEPTIEKWYISKVSKGGVDIEINSHTGETFWFQITARRKFSTITTFNLLL